MTTIIIVAIVIAIVLRIVRLLPRSACTGDCNQGRNCTCKEQ